MSGLEGISVKVESPGCREPESWGNAVPILHEIRHALARLLEQGEATIIDLRSIPMGPGDERRLFDALGEGELRAELDALGRSTIRESRYPAVWIVEHFNGNDEVVGRFVEITWIPSILQAQAEDVRAGLDSLAESLAADAGK
jgi:hydrogenase-1 operon protein HyaF